jgi:hypothetical protein
MKARNLLLWVVLIFWWTGAPARATTLVRMSLSQLSQASSTIVIGHVTSQKSSWNQAHTRIMTYTTVALDEALKGAPPSNLVIEQPGGTLGNFHVRVPGTAVFRPDGRYVLFLEPAGATPGVFLVVGMMQGALRVYHGGSPGIERVLLPLGAMRAGAGTQSLSQSVPLAEFHAVISKVISAPMVVPAGTSFEVKIKSTQFLGAGRLLVLGQTASDVFPNASVVIPAGSVVEGTAVRAGNSWKIHWTSLSVRGTVTKISSTGEEPANESLADKVLVIQTR